MFALTGTGQVGGVRGIVRLFAIDEILIATSLMIRPLLRPWRQNRVAVWVNDRQLAINEGEDALYQLTKRDIEHSPNKIGVFRVHFGGEIDEKYRRAILIFDVEPPIISGLLHRLD